MKIRNLEHKDKTNLVDLFKQLTGNIANPDIKVMLNDPGCYCLVLENSKGNVIGFGALVVHLVPSKGYEARIEDVVVDKSHRGKGYGKRITKELIKIAKKRNVKLINLTSNPKRVAARNLYQSLGFEIVETGVFRLEL